MNILFLTDNFPPETNAPASRTYEHAKEWVKSGAHVTVITTAPNFPNGKVHDGYKNDLYKIETMDGIKVIRVWTFITANQGFMLRTLDFISFMFSAIIASISQKKIDIIIGTSPQFFTALAACIISKLKRKPWIFEVRDLWPDSIVGLKYLKKGFLFKCLKKIEYFLYKDAKKIIVVTKSFKKILVENGIDKEKIKCITNGVDCNKFHPNKNSEELKNSLEISNNIVFGYIGTHGEAHGLETLLECAKKIQDNNAKVKFLFIGQGSKKKSLMLHAEANKLKNVIFLDSVSRDEIVNYWSVIDYSIIHLKKLEIFKTVIPSKIFESIAMQKPILIGVDGEAKEIIENNNLGLFFSPENVDELISKINFVLENPEEVKKFKINTEKIRFSYHRPNLAKKMLEIIERID